MTDLMTLLLALALTLGLGLGYVIQREIQYRWFRRWAPLLLTPQVANTSPPTELDDASYRDEWRP